MLNGTIKNTNDLRSTTPLFDLYELNSFGILKKLIQDFKNTQDEHKALKTVEAIILSIHSAPLTALDINNLLPELISLSMSKDYETQYAALLYLSSPIPNELAFKDLFKAPLIPEASYFSYQLHIANALQAHEAFNFHFDQIFEIIKLCVWFRNNVLLKWALSLSNIQIASQLSEFLPYAVKYDDPDLLELLIQNQVPYLASFQLFEDTPLNLNTLELAILYQKEKIVDKFLELNCILPEISQVEPLITPNNRPYFEKIQQRLESQTETHKTHSSTPVNKVANLFLAAEQRHTKTP